MKKLLFPLILCCSLVLISGCDNKTNIEIQNDKTLRLQHESEHFILLSCEKDNSCLDEIAKTLESNFERVTNNLGHKPEEKIKVYIFPDLKTLHKAIRQPNLPEWVVR